MNTRETGSGTRESTLGAGTSTTGAGLTGAGNHPSLADNSDNGAFATAAMAHDTGDVGGSGRNGGSGVRDAAKDVAQAAREEARRVASDARAQGRELIGEAKQQATGLVSEARSRIQAELDSRKSTVAEEIDNVARALRRASGELHEGQTAVAGPVAGSVDWAADGLESVARYVREQDVESLLRQGRDLAYRNPGLFVGGLVAAGFALGRFLKSSGSNVRRNSDEGAYGGYDDRYGDRYGRSYGGGEEFGRETGGAMGGTAMGDFGSGNVSQGSRGRTGRYSGSTQSYGAGDIAGATDRSATESSYAATGFGAGSEVGGDMTSDLSGGAGESRDVAFKGGEAMGVSTSGSLTTDGLGGGSEGGSALGGSASLSRPGDSLLSGDDKVVGGDGTSGEGASIGETISSSPSTDGSNASDAAKSKKGSGTGGGNGNR
ncbi:MAG TPA: hypothetical protein VEH84_11160 [Alphaproteobacteria bacterium]|nr:hypothetical protein [Alphaproteobacteria bacterium]